MILFLIPNFDSIYFSTNNVFFLVILKILKEIISYILYFVCTNLLNDYVKQKNFLSFSSLLRDYRN